MIGLAAACDVPPVVVERAPVEWPDAMEQAFLNAHV